MEESQIQHLHNSIEDYQQTVRAILAFSAFVIHDGQRFRQDSGFGLGRRMKTSDENRVSPSSTITPDLVAQKTHDYGIVVEVKKSMTRDRERWENTLVQLRKYDDELVGWWTDDERIHHSDTALLIHYSRSRKFVKYLQEKVAENPECFGPNSSVIEFVSSREASTYFAFRLEYGGINDAELQERLEDSVQVPLDKVLRTFPNVSFYDHEPPLPLLLTILWMDVLSSSVSDETYDEKISAHRINVNVEELTKELQKAYGSGARFLNSDSRSVEFPKTSWVRKALDTLCSNKLAQRNPDVEGEYHVFYRGFKKDVQVKFEEMCLKEYADDIPDEAQLEIFDEE